MILDDFDKKIINMFGIESFITISNLPKVERVSFKNNKPELLYEEAFDLLYLLLENEPFYARITFWNPKDFEVFFSNCISFNKKKDCSVGLFKFNFSDLLFKEILNSHLNYEIGLDPYLNITTYFTNFNLKTLVNIYDDRGADYIKKN